MPLAGMDQTGSEIEHDHAGVFLQGAGRAHVGDLPVLAWRDLQAWRAALLLLHSRDARIGSCAHL